ncbi:unnamed protein product [Caenorhabditis bovis]|uniref:HTH CENPB-type domain-containing protein n=1 Tax=Caenorhabditis bovis TaxID=2654633 RepID=A0A8S1F854_9PELO|nr:unnamed protein product [Caenorhabditis bovis]
MMLHNICMNSDTIRRSADEHRLEVELLRRYRAEVARCDRFGQSIQHIGDEWMRREIRAICGFYVSDRWIKEFRMKNKIKYFTGRRHIDTRLPATVAPTSKIRKPSLIKERRTRVIHREYENVDNEVWAEITRRQRNGERLTNPWIREFAHSVAAKLYPGNNHVIEYLDLNWLYRFKRRFSINLKPQDPPQTIEPPQPPPPPPPSTQTPAPALSLIPNGFTPISITINVPSVEVYDYFTRLLVIQNYLYFISNYQTRLE